MNPRILALDDDAPVARAVRRLLSSAGFDCTAVTTPEEARAALAQGDIAVILCDERMPSIRGVDFLEECAREYPDTVRILLTGYADAQAASEAVNRAEVFRLLWKPWSDVELVAIVRQAAWKHALISDEAPPAPPRHLRAVS